MSLPRYPKYKDSGVEWLGEVPDHWEVRKLISRLRESPCYGVLVPDFDADGVPMLRITDMEAGRARREELLTISRALSAQYQRTVVAEGDVILSVVGTIGEALRVTPELAGVNLSRAVARIRLAADFDGGFLCWAFRSVAFLRYIDLVCVGSAQKVLNMEDLRIFRMAFPSATEQQSIAAFLDRETAKIDALVAEQERLIELLKEKRQAVISHAVTKGLNPKVPMKDSGVEWLGEIPAHWDCLPLKRACAVVKDGTHLPPSRVEDGIPLLSVRNIVDGAFVLRADDSMISEESYQELCRGLLPMEGDVLLAIVGATLGKTAVVGGGLGRFQIQRSLAIFRTRKEVLTPGYLHSVFRSNPFQQQLWTLVGYSAQPGIYLGTLGDMRVPVPPIQEQAQLVRLLAESSGQLDALTTEAQRAIDLLQERRTALISAAVTGQIDVRKASGKAA